MIKIRREFNEITSLPMTLIEPPGEGKSLLIYNWGFTPKLWVEYSIIKNK